MGSTLTSIVSFGVMKFVIDYSINSTTKED